jgi:hypothetical protein
MSEVHAETEAKVPQPQNGAFRVVLLIVSVAAAAVVLSGLPLVVDHII